MVKTEEFLTLGFQRIEEDHICIVCGDPVDFDFFYESLTNPELIEEHQEGEQSDIVIKIWENEHNYFLCPTCFLIFPTVYSLGIARFNVEILKRNKESFLKHHEEMIKKIDKHYDRIHAAKEIFSFSKVAPILFILTSVMSLGLILIDPCVSGNDYLLSLIFFCVMSWAILGLIGGAAFRRKA